MVVTVSEYVMMLSESLYQSKGDSLIENVVELLEKINKLIEGKDISKENLEYMNVIISNILGAMEIKDWIFVSDILRYELKNLIEEI